LPLIVMYHQLNDDGVGHAFTTEKFRNQLAFLQKKYRFATLSEWLSGHANDDCCILTFDDGFLDCYANALPIMDEFGAKGVFFIPGLILTSRKIISSAKRSMTLFKIGIDAYLDRYNAIVPPYFQVHEGKAVDAWNDPKTSILKHMLDLMEHESALVVIDTIFSEYFDEDEEFKKLFMTTDMLKEMHSKGHEIGGHGHEHRFLGRLYPSDQLSDLKAGIEAFDEKLGFKPSVMSYPFGSHSAITVNIVKHLGFKAALLDPSSSVAVENIYEINRFDCIDINETGLPDIRSRVTDIHK
jgi:peptidoglycan/xylan/chitin deacetylase (PgdA/CDA1 family)